MRGHAAILWIGALVSVLIALPATAQPPQIERLDREAYRINPTKDSAAPFGVYVPADLDDAIGELKKMLSPALVEDMKTHLEREMVVHHMSLGMWMRNYWALWKGSRLGTYFNNLGITHPDDMSGIVLTSFWRHLNNRPIELEAQIVYYKAYWEEVFRHEKERQRK